jgi:antitoxin ParD1/3/4
VVVTIPTMGKVEKISIALTEDLAGLVRGAVEDGPYASASEVIREALRDWNDKRQRRAAAQRRIGALWDEGIASGAPLAREPMDEIIARNRAELERRKRG